MSKKGRDFSSNIKKAKRKKLGEFYYSWHFWFIHTLVLLTVIFSFIASKGQWFITLLSGFAVYLIPMFIYYIRNVGTLENLKQFYTKSIRRSVKNRK